MNDAQAIALALEEAKSAALRGEVPVGAVLLDGDGALLTAHFLSDVLIGAGIGLIAAREVLQLGFPGFAPTWF